MARPKKFTLDFFVHDANARNDRRLKPLTRKHGNDGYATYFCLLEMLCSEDEIKLNLSNSIDLENAAAECNLRDEAHFHKILITCIELGLFDRQLWEGERILFCPALHDRYVQRLEDRKQAAIRQQRKAEADNLQKRINQVEGIEAEVITELPGVITRDNEVLHRDKPPDIRDQNLESRDQSLEVRSTHTDPDVRVCVREEIEIQDEPESDPVQQNHQPPAVQVNVPPPPAALQPSQVSACARSDRAFEPLYPWQQSNIKFDFDPGFVEHVLKNYLPTLSCYKGKTPTIDKAQQWINGAAYGQKRMDDALLQWEVYTQTVTAQQQAEQRHRAAEQQRLERLQAVEQEHTPEEQAAIARRQHIARLRIKAALPGERDRAIREALSIGATLADIGLEEMQV